MRPCLGDPSWAISSFDMKLIGPCVFWVDVYVIANLRSLLGCMRLSFGGDVAVRLVRLWVDETTMLFLPPFGFGVYFDVVLGGLGFSSRRAVFAR